MALAVSAAACIAAAHPFDSPETPRLTLAVLRRDGLMLPFASYDGRWKVPWPQSLTSVNLPISLENVPSQWWGAAGPAAPWTAWLTNGDHTPLKPNGLRQVRVFCSTRLLVQTDYRGEPVNPREPTAAKDGLAIAGNAELLPVQSISLVSPDAKAMIELLRDEFNQEERRAAQRFTEWKHPYKEEQRKAFPIQLEAFYRATNTTTKATWMSSYVEAVRRFPPRSGDEGCGLITFARAWVMQQEGRKPQIDLTARVTYCDREGVAFMQPFGRLLLKDEIYWIYQMSSWRDEGYGVARLSPKGMEPVLATSTGCPR